MSPLSSQGWPRDIADSRRARSPNNRSSPSRAVSSCTPWSRRPTCAPSTRHLSAVRLLRSSLFPAALPALTSPFDRLPVFEKNFAVELARLPDQGFYEPASSGHTRGSSSIGSSTPSASGPRRDGVDGARISLASTAAATAPTPPASRRESVSAQAANDLSLVSRAGRAQPPSAPSSAAHHPRTASVSSSCLLYTSPSPRDS